MNNNLDGINNCLVRNCGMLFLQNENNLSNAQRYCQPYKSAADFFLRALPIVTAPVCLTLLIIENIALSMIVSINLILNLSFLKNEAALKNLQKLMHLSISTTFLLLSVLFAPVVYLIDVIGGGLAQKQNSATPDALKFDHLPHN